MNLKDNHKKALELIRRELSAGRRFPTLQEIARHTDAKHRSVAKSYLNVLSRKKLISRDAKSGQYILSNFSRRFEHIDPKSTDHNYDRSTEPFFIEHDFFGTNIKVHKVTQKDLKKSEGIFSGDLAVISELEVIQINEKGIFLWKLKNGRLRLQRKPRRKDGRQLMGKLVGIIRKLTG